MSEKSQQVFLLTACDEKCRVARGRRGKTVKPGRTNTLFLLILFTPHLPQTSTPLGTCRKTSGVGRSQVLWYPHQRFYTSATQTFTETQANLLTCDFFNLHNPKAKSANWLHGLHSPAAKRKKKSSSLDVEGSFSDCSPGVSAKGCTIPFSHDSAFRWSDEVSAGMICDWQVEQKAGSQETLFYSQQLWHALRQRWGGGGGSILFLTPTASQVEVTFTTRRRLQTPCSAAQHAENRKNRPFLLTLLDMIKSERNQRSSDRHRKRFPPLNIPCFW